MAEESDDDGDDEDSDDEDDADDEEDGLDQVTNQKLKNRLVLFNCRFGWLFPWNFVLVFHHGYDENSLKIDNR